MVQSRSAEKLPGYQGSDTARFKSLHNELMQEISTKQAYDKLEAVDVLVE